MGIGLALARLFARDNFHLVLVGRDEERLRAAGCELRVPDALLLPCDLTAPDAPRLLHEEITRRGIRVEILVNNAGFGVFGSFEESDPAATHQMLMLNIIALTDLTRLLLPSMVEHGSGRIMNVASTAAFAPGPLMAAYYASKAYVLSLSDALSNELEGTGVTVTCLCPGPTRTAFQERAGVQFSPMVSSAIMDVSPVAEAGYRGLMRGRRTVIPGLKNRFLVAVASLTPRHLAARIIRRMQEDKRRK